MREFDCHGCDLGIALIAITTARAVATIDSNSAIGAPGVESIEWNEIAGVFYSSISPVLIVMVIIIVTILGIINDSSEWE